MVRREHASDNRSVDVYPTDKAREVYPFLIQIGEEWSQEITSGMTEIERSIFFQLLQKTSGNIGAYFARQNFDSRQNEKK